MDQAYNFFFLNMSDFSVSISSFFQATSKIKIMELDFGPRFSRIMDEFSSAELQFAKDRTGPIFVSSETDKMFILSAHLKGYKRGNIKIEINEDGTRIAVSGEKSVLETIMVGGQVYKKGVETKGFRKAFKIPDGVILDEIMAKFNDDESVLTITMPKKVKGIRGIGIEEVKDQEIAREGSGSLQIVDDETSPGEPSKEPESDLAIEKSQLGKNSILPQVVKEKHDHQKENAEESKSGPNQLTQNAASRSVQSSDKAPFVEKRETRQEKWDKHEIKQQDIQEKIESGCDHGDLSCSKLLADQHQHRNDQLYGNQEKADDNKEVDKQSAVVKQAEETQEGEYKKREEAGVPERRSLICAPIVAGSAILVSLVVFAFHMIRRKNQPDKRRS